MKVSMLSFQGLNNEIDKYIYQWLRCQPERKFKYFVAWAASAAARGSCAAAGSGEGRAAAPSQRGHREREREREREIYVFSTLWFGTFVANPRPPLLQ